MSTETIKVLLVDEYPVVREGVRAMLETEEEIEVVCEASNGLEAVAKAGECQPNVVLMEIVMPALDGLEATRRIKKQYPKINVIILTAHAHKAFVINAIEAGANGYLLKTVSRNLLCHAIRAVNSGGIVIKGSLLREAVAAAAATAMEYQGGATRALSGVEEFSSREREVLGLLADGQTNKEIGRELDISEETAKKHVQSIIAKLDACDRTQAAVRAVRIGLIKKPTAKYIGTHLTEDSNSHNNLPSSSP